MTATIEKPTALETGGPNIIHRARAPRRSNIRVWLTDDNASLRNTLADLLGRTGAFDCDRQFHSAEALLEALALEPAPDVILLDIEMGGMRGVDALPQIRVLAPTVRVLILTTFFDPLYEAQASQGGAAAFLLKSFAFERFTAEIHRALAGPLRAVETAVVSSPSRPAAVTSARTKPGVFARLSLWAGQFATLIMPEAYRRPATPK